MKLTNILTPDCTLCAVPVSSKKKILEEICTIAAEKIAEHTTYELLESLMERENMGSTGIGNGIAIPHGRLSQTQKAVAVLITSKEVIEFDAIDNRPVDIFFAIFVPEESCKEHLITLQSIATLFSDKQFCKQVRKCENNDELFQLINQADK